MKMTYECPKHDEWEELDLFRGFVFAVQIDDEGVEGHAMGETYPGVVQWLDGEELKRIVFADGEEATHLMEHVVNDLTGESGNGYGKPDDVMVHIGVEPGPTDAELDAWLTERFGEDKQPLPGHKFNRAFARELIEFGRSFT